MKAVSIACDEENHRSAKKSFRACSQNAAISTQRTSRKPLRRKRISRVVAHESGATSF